MLEADQNKIRRKAMKTKQIIRNFLKTKNAYYYDGSNHLDWDSLFDYCFKRHYDFKTVSEALEDEGYELI